MNDLSFDLLAPFLLSSDEKHVSLALFADTVEWFGYFFQPQHSLRTLEEVFAIVNSEWFAGPITRQQAEYHVNSKQNCPLPDTFLVRLSASFPGCPFTITRPAHSTRRPNLRVKRLVNYNNLDSCLTSGQSPFSYVVEYGADGTSPPFTSLPALIDGLKSDLRLHNPAPPISSSTGGY